MGSVKMPLRMDALQAQPMLGLLLIQAFIIDGDVMDSMVVVIPALANLENQLMGSVKMLIETDALEG